MRKSLLILLLTAFMLISVPAVAEGNNPAGSLNFTDKVVYFQNHTSDPAEGNWITMGDPYEGRRIQLPQPIKITYNGPNYEEYGGASWTLNKDENESFTITYPSNASYTSHPAYLPDENVTMSFHGESDLEGENVEIYLFKVTSDCVYGLLDAFTAGDIENLNTLFQDSVGEYEKYSAGIGENGDLSDYDLGCLDAGQYCIVMIHQNDDGSMTILSSTVFVVTEYDLSLSYPSSIVKGNDLDISITLVDGASDENNCTYGAVLIKEQIYKANIEINSDGTRSGTSVIVNDLDIIEEFDINSSNYRSRLTKNELQTEIQALIGEGNGAIAIGETGQKELSLTAFDLSVGNYYLLVGVYSPEKGLVGLSQREVEIEAKSQSNGGGGSGGSSGGGSPEPAKNVKTKELCQQFVSNGNRIQFEFTEGDLPVGYVEFDAKKTAGRITTVVEELKDKSSLTPTEPEGNVYKYINIWVGNGGYSNPENIGNAVVGFKVSKEWITENSINTDTIILQHFDGEQWDSLDTEKVEEDEEYIYFEAETPGFSPFAITAGKNVIKIEKIDEQNTYNSDHATGSEISKMESSEESGNSVLRIASFFIGFLAIIAIGTIIKKKIE